MVQARRGGPAASKDIEEHLKAIYEDVPELVEKLLNRKNIPLQLVENARCDMHHSREGRVERVLC